MKDSFEQFYGRRRRERESYESKRVREQAGFEKKRSDEMAAFKESLREMAEQRKPAGKLVRPKGLAAMFT